MNLESYRIQGDILLLNGKKYQIVVEDNNDNLPIYLEESMSSVSIIRNILNGKKTWFTRTGDRLLFYGKIDCPDILNLGYAYFQCDYASNQNQVIFVYEADTLIASLSTCDCVKFVRKYGSLSNQTLDLMCDEWMLFQICIGGLNSAR